MQHLFRVAASLDSMVLGEPQILGQMKAAYRQATEHQATGPILNRLLHKAFSVAKRVRTETGIGDHAVSVSYAAVSLARKIFGELTGMKVLLVGAGEMAELALEHLRGQKVGRIIVANRTLERGVRLAERYGGEAVSLEELEAQLLSADILISSTGSETICSPGPGQGRHAPPQTAASLPHRHRRAPGPGPGHQRPGQRLSL